MTTGGTLDAGAAIAVAQSDGGSIDSVGVNERGVSVRAAVGADVAGAFAIADLHVNASDGASDPGELDAVVAGAVDADEAGNGGTDIPGGGAATASGSSISSNGKSGNCSSKGETGTTADAFDNAGFAEVSGAGDVLAAEIPAEATPTGLVVFFVADVGASRLTPGPVWLADAVVPGLFAAALGAAAETALSRRVFFERAPWAGAESSRPTPFREAPAPAAELSRPVAIESDPPRAAVPTEVPPRAAVPSPLVPSKRAGAPGSETPSNTSGSSSSDDPISVGTSAESGRASGAAAPDPEGDADGADAAGPSSPTSSRAPCDSKSSSDSIVLFAVDAAVDPESDEDAAIEEEVRLDGDPITADPIGSSTGRSVKGSKAGREAASIVFEPESRRTFLTVSCNGAAELPRRWLTERQGRPGIVTYVTLCGLMLSIFSLQ